MEGEKEENSRIVEREASSPLGYGREREWEEEKIKKRKRIAARRTRMGRGRVAGGR